MDVDNEKSPGRRDRDAITIGGPGGALDCPESVAQLRCDLPPIGAVAVAHVEAAIENESEALVIGRPYGPGAAPQCYGGTLLLIISQEYVARCDIIVREFVGGIRILVAARREASGRAPATGEPNIIPGEFADRALAAAIRVHDVSVLRDRRAEPSETFEGYLPIIRRPLRVETVRKEAAIRAIRVGGVYGPRRGRKIVED